ncbi:MAG TPA: hypothetical protein VM263_03380, partial [Acidimicrobiales bacterium]|nr:hypothetical protein [Acidimicrobiales bacterium]
TAALALVALTRGRLGAAVELGRRAADLAPRPDQSLGVAALAAAYGGDVALGTELAGRLAAIATSPTLEGFAHYVAGEVAAVAGDVEGAEERYRRAIALGRRSGATFVEGIASVGLLTVRAAAGRVGEALDGYRGLLDYWERTGGWAQQWTTLRNLARLLRDLGDHDVAGLLDAAADAAPDAPPPAGPRSAPGAGGLDAARAAAPPAGRAEVLAVARAAIARHRRAVPSP